MDDVCTATTHTPSAYRKGRCVCPSARDAEAARKRKARATENARNRHQHRAGKLIGLVVADLPPFLGTPGLRCGEVDPDDMFPENVVDLPLAQRVCHDCPVRIECREWAVETNQIHGVWGGLSPADIRKAHNRRRNMAGAR